MHITVDCVILIANIREVIQMQSIANSISLQSFYPENLNIMSIEQDDTVIRYRENYMQRIIKKFKTSQYWENELYWILPFMNSNAITLIVIL